MNKKWIAGIMIVIAIFLAVYSYIALPDLVTVQIDFSGNPSRQEPKLLALLFPLVLTIGGSIAYIVSERKEISAIGNCRYSCCNYHHHSQSLKEERNFQFLKKNGFWTHIVGPFLSSSLSLFDIRANYDTMTQRKLKENVDEYFKCRKINTRLR